MTEGEEKDMGKKKKDGKKAGKGRLYLAELGLSPAYVVVPDTEDVEIAGKDRLKKYRKERKRYGFDTRETWNLDATASIWLYERLRAFEDATICDMEAGPKKKAFTVGLDGGAWKETEHSGIQRHLEFGTEELSLGKCVRLAEAYLADYAKTEKRQRKARKAHPKCPVAESVQEALDRERGKAAFRTIAEILPDLWW